MRAVNRAYEARPLPAISLRGLPLGLAISALMCAAIFYFAF